MVIAKVYILWEQDKLTLFPGKNWILDLIRKPLVIVVAQNTIFPT